MRIHEVTNQLLNPSNPTHLKWLKSLDNYTGNSNFRLPDDLKQYLRKNKSNSTGSIRLYRNIQMDKNEFSEAFNIPINEVKRGLKFIYHRNKESSWTKSLDVALEFGSEWGETGIVIFALVQNRNILIDIEKELDKNTFDHSYLSLDQKEVIVDQVDIPSVIIQV